MVNVRQYNIIIIIMYCNGILMIIIIIIIITPGLHNKIPAHKIFARVWVAQKSLLFHR